MHYGWLKLTKHSELPIYIWAADVEMVSDLGDDGSMVFLHHDKINVRESAEDIIASIDKITERSEAAEASETMRNQ